jgi:O-antigen/teichoic acid export membrane protein
VKRPLFILAADQAISSLITLALSVYAARDSSIDEFGIFAVGYALSWVFLGVSRSILGELNLIIGPEKLAETPQWRSFTTTSSLATGLVSGVLLFIGCSLLAPSSPTWIPWSFAVAIPLVIIADGMRYVAFTDEVPRDALMLDVTWLAGTLLVPPALATTGVPPVPSALLGWGFGAGLGAAFSLLLRSRLRPKLRGARAWTAGRRVTATQFAGDFLAGNGIGQLATALVPIVASLAAAGGLRAGYVILGPLNVVGSAMLLFLIPRMRNSLSPDHALPKLALAVWGAFCAFCGMFALAVIVIPDRTGEFLLGPSWQPGQAVAPVLIAGFIFATMVQIIVQVMRLRSSAGLVIPVRLFVSVIQSVGLLVGAAMLGSMGAAAGSALAALLAVVPWWVALQRSQREFHDGDGSRSGDPR